MGRRLLAPLGAFVLLAGAAVAVAPAAEAATSAEINASAKAALARCKTDVAGCKSAAGKAKGILVFGEVTKAGVGVGGSYGEGALFVGGKIAGHYSATSASIGLQLGAEKFSEIIMFMTKEALTDFRNSPGWEAGGSAAVTMIDESKGANIDTITANQPVIAFIFGKQGLMGSLSLEGTKISRIER